MNRRSFMSCAGSCLGALAYSCSLANYERDSLFTKNTGYLYDDRYLLHQGSPESSERLVKIQEKLNQTGIIEDVLKLSLFDRNPEPWIEMIHTRAHIDSIKNIDVSGEVALLAVQGALGAVNAVHTMQVANAFCALRPPGHHAHNSGGNEGFCYFNNVAIAARYIQKTLGYNKVLIIDWDYHHGNSTQDAFYTDPSILFFSTHNFYTYPGTGDPALKGDGEKYGLNINVHLEPGAKDYEMLKAWEEQLLPVAEKFRPDFVLISAGFDSRMEDLLGTFSLTDDCFCRMTGMAMNIAEQYCENRLVSLLEGGYNVDGLANAVHAHISSLLSKKKLSGQ